VATLLFNRNREPPDQPRNLVQSRGIVIFDGACEPSEAFVITHCDYIDRNDRRYGPYAIGLDIWHRTTSAESGAVHGPWRMSLFGARLGDAEASPHRLWRASDRDFGLTGSTANICPAGSFYPLLM
jgi:hypothetical protein